MDVFLITSKKMSTYILVSALPDEYIIFRPIIDVMPEIPILFLALAFVWQASIGFR